MMTILECEAASAFEEITFSNSDDTMQWQSPQAWPNTFRSSLVRARERADPGRAAAFAGAR